MRVLKIAGSYLHPTSCNHQRPHPRPFSRKREKGELPQVREKMTGGRKEEEIETEKNVFLMSQFFG